jgi:hypothetical protein
MLKSFLIKLLGGYTPGEVANIRNAELDLTEQVRALEPYKEFTDSISFYVGNYPAWKAQSEYRQAMSDLGRPLSGEYPSKGMSYPTHAENVDLYLGRLVDGFSELKQKVPGSVPGTHWGSVDLASARGGIFLQTP